MNIASMAVTHRQPDSLPHRIAESARELACSVVFGVAGTEASLKDARHIAKHADSTITDYKQEHAQAVLLPRSRIAGKAFRSQVEASSSHAVEEEFRHFVEDTALTTAKYDISIDLLIVDDRNSERSCTAAREVLGESIDGNIALESSLDLRLQQAVFSSEQSSATRRLELLNSQVKAIGSEQSVEFQQRSDIASHLCREAFYDQPDPPRQQDLARQPCGGGYAYQTPRTQSRSERSETGSDEDPRPFYCPYYACHSRFLWQNCLGSRPPFINRCVHADCDYISRVYSDWLHHVRTPHHDIQGFADVSDGHGSNDRTWKTTRTNFSVFAAAL